jgi:hypothetical protein
VAVELPPPRLLRRRPAIEIQLQRTQPAASASAPGTTRTRQARTENWITSCSAVRPTKSSAGQECFRQWKLLPFTISAQLILPPRNGNQSLLVAAGSKPIGGAIQKIRWRDALITRGGSSSVTASALIQTAGAPTHRASTERKTNRRPPALSGRHRTVQRRGAPAGLLNQIQPTACFNPRCSGVVRSRGAGDAARKTTEQCAGVLYAGFWRKTRRRRR